MILQLLGACVLVKLFCSALKTFYGIYGGWANVDARLKSYGSWAVITGCTRGIGREFSLQLAQKGMNIVLVSRNENQLMELAKTMETDYGVKTCVVVLDFKNLTFEDLDTKFYQKIKDLDVGILINNAGVMYDVPLTFERIPESKIDEMMSVNMRSHVMITHLTLNQIMIPKNRGIILFMSSGVSTHPTPQMALYGATKKFINYFASSLSAELGYSGSDVKIQTLVPFYIATHMGNYSNFLSKPQRLLVPSAQTYVSSAINCIGTCSKTTGYWDHSIQTFLYDSFVPEFLWQFAAYVWFNRMMKIK